MYFPCELWIDEKISMPGEANLHQTPAILWHDDELNPSGWKPVAPATLDSRHSRLDTQYSLPI